MDPDRDFVQELRGIAFCSFSVMNLDETCEFSLGQVGAQSYVLRALLDLMNIYGSS